MQKLSIAIPTYNRPNNARILLESLLLELNRFSLHEYLANSLEVIIIDNASTVSYETCIPVAEEINSCCPLRWIKNQYNSGLVGNVWNCFVNSKYDYVWTIGDDDIVSPGSLEAIFSAIQKKPSHITSKTNSSGEFSLSHFHYEIISRENTLAKFSHSSSFISSLSFISANVFRKELILSKQSLYYLFSNTLCPWIAIYVREYVDSTLAYSDLSFSLPQQYDDKRGWSLISGALGFPSLVNSVDDIESKTKLASAISDWLPPLDIAIELASQSIKNSHNKNEASRLCRYYFRYMWASVYSLGRQKWRLQWRMLSLLANQPQLLRSILVAYKSRSGRKLIPVRDNFERL